MDLKNRLINQYGLSISAAIDVITTVKALDKYDMLPTAIKDNMQVICDQFNVGFDFSQRRGKLFLFGIVTSYQTTYLYPEDRLADSQKLLKNNKKTFRLSPGGKNIFEVIKGL